MSDKKEQAMAIKREMNEEITKLISNTAQKLFDVGLELEDMELTPELYKVASNVLSFSGWTPKHSGPAVVQPYKEPQT